MASPDERAEHVRIWEFRVRENHRAAFEEAYGSEGAWASLFATAEGYLGTELLRDATTPLRYLTIDRWTSVEAFELFHAAKAGEYAALDARCEPWTETETPIGVWVLERR